MQNIADLLHHVHAFGRGQSPQVRGHPNAAISSTHAPSCMHEGVRACARIHVPMHVYVYMCRNLLEMSTAVFAVGSYSSPAYGGLPDLTDKHAHMNSHAGRGRRRMHALPDTFSSLQSVHVAANNMHMCMGVHGGGDGAVGVSHPIVERAKRPMAEANLTNRHARMCMQVCRSTARSQRVLILVPTGSRHTHVLPPAMMRSEPLNRGKALEESSQCFARVSHQRTKRSSRVCDKQIAIVFALHTDDTRLDLHCWQSIRHCNRSTR